MQYLMIENVGETNPECFTLLGASTTRVHGGKANIGQFGSGSKHAINMLLRNDITPTIFTGTLRLDFFTQGKTIEETVNGSKQSSTFNQVCVRLSGKTADGKTVKRTDELGFVVEYGAYDWIDIAQGLQEFMSNAIDRSIMELGTIHGVFVQITDSVRAKSGYTRVYIPITPDVQKFYRQINQRYLHFSENDALERSVLPKSARNVTPDRKTAVIYKRGVFVREINNPTDPSLFDYNLDNLDLDESRNANDYLVKYHATRALTVAPVETLVTLFGSLIGGEKFWEATFDQYDLNPEYRGTNEEWKKAWSIVAGEKGVICPEIQEIAEIVKRKGFIPHTVPNGWYHAAKKAGIKTAASILSSLELDGKTIIEPTDDVVAVEKWVWDRLELAGFTYGKSIPPVKCFDCPMSGEGQHLGEYNDGTVYIHKDIAVGESPMLRQTMLEELCHFITGATDNSRDFQDFAFRVATSFMGVV